MGTEIIVGILEDRTFETRGVVGPGGVGVSSSTDVGTLIPPYTQEYVAAEMTRRGIDRHLVRNGNDIEVVARGVAELLGVLSAMVTESGGAISELECNPVVFNGTGAVVLDALAICRTTAPAADSTARRGTVEAG